MIIITPFLAISTLPNHSSPELTICHTNLTSPDIITISGTSFSEKNPRYLLLYCLSIKLPGFEVRILLDHKVWLVPKIEWELELKYESPFHSARSFVERCRIRRKQEICKNSFCRIPI